MLIGGEPMSILIRVLTFFGLFTLAGCDTFVFDGNFWSAFFSDLTWYQWIIFILLIVFIIIAIVGGLALLAGALGLEALARCCGKRNLGLD